MAPSFAACKRDGVSMLLLVNADNISGEGLPYLIDGLMDRGAASVHAVPAVTKKGRSEFLFFIDAPRSCLQALGAFLALELDTLGMRVIEPEHVPFTPVRHRVVGVAAEGLRGASLEVRVKETRGTDGARSCKAEYDDLERVLQSGMADPPLSFKIVKSAVELAVMSGEPVHVGGLGFTPPEETEGA
ncbi:MAG: LarC family nickel insertion protein [Synergistales bacterium]|nr:LarC family nickel insertion protein [Synergistales bacterium]